LGSEESQVRGGVRPRLRSEPTDRLRRQTIEGLHRELEVLFLRVLELRMRQASEALDEEHHRRDSRPRDLGRVVQRAAGEPVRPAGDLLDRLVRELDQPVVEEDRLDVPDALELDVDPLLLCESPAALARVREQRREARRVQMALVEKLLRRLDDRSDDAWGTDDTTRGADGGVSGWRRDLAELQRELGGSGERVPTLIHRRRAGVRRLAAPRDAVAFDPVSPKYRAQRQIDRLEHRPLAGV